MTRVEAQLDAILRPRLGYTISPWPPALMDRVHALARAARQTPDHLLARVAAGQDAELISELIAAATITHTAFFRHPEHFQRLEGELRTRRGAFVRFLCVGCSRGEEAYSLACTAERAGASYAIDAIDINSEALAHAERGQYDARTASNVPDNDPVRGWSAPAHMRERIRFERCSIADALRSPRYASFDYVFCRNMLIYFPPEGALAIVTDLRARVARQGALVVAPTEALAVLPAGLERSTPMGWLLRTDVAATKTAARAQLRPDPISPAQVGGQPLERLAHTMLQGEDVEAELMAWLETRPEDAVAWFMLGEKLVQRTQPVQACIAFEHAITHATHATLVDEPTLRAAAQRRISQLRRSDTPSVGHARDRRQR